MPYTRYPNSPHAGVILKYIKEMSSQYLTYDYIEDLGVTKIDTENFYRMISKEGIIKLLAPKEETHTFSFTPPPPPDYSS